MRLITNEKKSKIQDVTSKFHRDIFIQKVLGKCILFFISNIIIELYILVIHFTSIK